VSIRSIQTQLQQLTQERNNVLAVLIAVTKKYGAKCGRFA
jgi:hypothetical protein